MAVQGGQLLWNRRRITLDPGANTIDTGLREPSRSGTPDPSIDGVEPSVDSAGRASRVMVIPMAPIDDWLGVRHEEPHVVDGVVQVVFNNTNVGAVTINVAFWDPHTLPSPVSADTYNPQPEPPPACEDPEGCFPISASVFSNGTS